MSPLGDGKSGAAGNMPKAQGNANMPASRPQKMGDNGANPASVPSGGKSPFPSADPGSRDGLVTQVAEKVAHKPFKLPGGGSPYNAGHGGVPSSGSDASDPADIKDGGPVGDIPNADQEP